jgi:hypothetical protein
VFEHNNGRGGCGCGCCGEVEVEVEVMISRQVGKGETRMSRECGCETLSETEASWGAVDKQCKGGGFRGWRLRTLRICNA